MTEHGMSRRLELAAKHIMERAPDSLTRTMLDGAQCIDVLWGIKGRLADHIADLEAQLADARRDAERLDRLESARLGATPLAGGGWDVYAYEEGDGKETLLGSRTTLRAAIDEADAAMGATHG